MIRGEMGRKRPDRLDSTYRLPDGAAKIPHVRVGGMKVAPVSRLDICRIIAADCRPSDPAVRRPKGARLLFDSNGHALSLAARDREYREAVEQADLVHADGQVIVAAARALTKGEIPERSATTDLIHDVAETAAAEGLSFYLLGGDPGLAEQCADILSKRYPGLKIAGCHHGYFDISEEEAVCEQINASGADIVWVGLGKTKEQLFCIRNRSRLDAAWAVTCGGCFRYVTGDYSRAPEWMQKAGLEWLFRVLTDPKKFFWRYATTNPHALFLIATRTSRDFIQE